MLDTNFFNVQQASSVIKCQSSICRKTSMIQHSFCNTNSVRRLHAWPHAVGRVDPQGHLSSAGRRIGAKAPTVATKKTKRSSRPERPHTTEDRIKLEDIEGSHSKCTRNANARPDNPCQKGKANSVGQSMVNRTGRNWKIHSWHQLTVWLAGLIVDENRLANMPSHADIAIVASIFALVTQLRCKTLITRPTVGEWYLTTTLTCWCWCYWSRRVCRCLGNVGRGRRHLTVIEEGELRMSCRLELKIIKDSTQTLNWLEMNSWAKQTFASFEAGVSGIALGGCCIGLQHGCNFEK